MADESARQESDREGKTRTHDMEKDLAPEEEAELALARFKAELPERAARVTAEEMQQLMELDAQFAAARRKPLALPHSAEISLPIRTPSSDWNRFRAAARALSLDGGPTSADLLITGYQAVRDTQHAEARGQVIVDALREMGEVALRQIEEALRRRSDPARMLVAIELTGRLGAEELYGELARLESDVRLPAQLCSAASAVLQMGGDGRRRQCS